MISKIKFNGVGGLLVRDTESPLLFHHSSRVYYWGALAGKRRGFRFDPELLCAGAMFRDMGLTRQHSSAQKRFEVDGANAARDFLRGHGIPQQDVDTVWTAIVLHTTPGIPQHMHPVVALVTAIAAELKAVRKVAGHLGFEFVHYVIQTLVDLEGAFASGLREGVSVFYISASKPRRKPAEVAAGPQCV